MPCKEALAVDFSRIGIRFFVIRSGKMILADGPPRGGS
jgi:hypothetical protein